MHMQAIKTSIALADREETDLPAKRQMTSVNNQYSPLFTSEDYGYGESLA